MVALAHSRGIDPTGDNMVVLGVPSGAGAGRRGFAHDLRVDAMARRLMSTPGRRFGALLVLLCVTCRDVGHVYRLTTALNREFADTRMGASLTDGVILTVTVAAPVLVTASCQTQVGIALRIGRFLREYDTNLASLQVVNVAFAPERKNASAPVRNAHLPIRFSPARIRAGLSASDSTDAVGSCKAYEDLGGR